MDFLCRCVDLHQEPEVAKALKLLCLHLSNIPTLRSSSKFAPHSKVNFNFYYNTVDDKK